MQSCKVLSRFLFLNFNKLEADFQKIEQIFAYISSENESLYKSLWNIETEMISRDALLLRLELPYFAQSLEDFRVPRLP